MQTPLKKADSGIGSGTFSSCSRILSFDFLTPTKLSTPTRVVISFTDAVRRAISLGSSVTEFYQICLKLIPTYFVELDSSNTIRFEEYFKDAMKQVFPWFDPATVDTSNIRDILSGTVKLEAAEFKDDYVIPPEEAQVEVRDIDEDSLHNCIAFEDILWDSKSFMDERACSFCNELGDFPVHSCVRLLYAGPGDWVHVNCAIWSSEVWEEDNGALQQVEAALTRSKRTTCDDCGESGASLNCCASSCRRCYHFLCAMSSDCFLLEGKTLFCLNHQASAKGQVQKNMHVTRKVFVDLENSRKKDMKVPSSNVRVFIGSMRINALGYVVPVLVVDETKYILPVGYEAERLLSSSESSDSVQLYSMSTNLNTKGDFCPYLENLTSTNE